MMRTTNAIYQWVQGVYQQMIFENPPHVIKFPCSKCGANRPTIVKPNDSVEIGICPCKKGKEE